MIFIEHRLNRLEEMAAANTSNGVEIDLRTIGSKMIVAHDPFQDGVVFETWLKEFAKRKFGGPLILNTKEDGLEPNIVKTLEANAITNYLFLDTAFPTFIKYTETMPDRFMLRLSEYEYIDAAMAFAGRVNWLWVDCFHGTAVDEKILERASKSFKLCMVSPELQGYDLIHKIDDFRKLKSYFSAICTKHADLWSAALR